MSVAGKISHTIAPAYQQPNNNQRFVRTILARDLAARTPSKAIAAVAQPNISIQPFAHLAYLHMIKFGLTLGLISIGKFIYSARLLPS
jgi:hypothetical protein